MKILSRDEILGANDIPREVVEVPEWGGAVWVYGLTGAERDAFEAETIGEEKKNKRMNFQNLRARLCALAIRDEEGKRVFSRNDVELLGCKSCAGLVRVYDVAQRLSGLTDEDVEQLSGNSETGQSAGSTSD